MAFKVQDSGVLYTKGRGANAVALEISFKRLEAWAKKQKIDTPRLWHRSFGRACAGLKRQLLKVMKAGGGLEGVPKFRDFEDFTKQIREKRGISSRPMGGILTDKGSIVAFKRPNGDQVVGWPDGMEKLVNAFQEGLGGSVAESWFTDPDLRRSWHRDGYRDIPPSYVHNSRMILRPYFEDHVKKHLDEWAEKNYFKELARQMKKQGAF